jgi:predicted RNA polymerase sigma factor
VAPSGPNPSRSGDLRGCRFAAKAAAAVTALSVQHQSRQGPRTGGFRQRYAALHVAHADLLRRAGGAEAAAASLRRAVEATRNDALRGELTRRLGTEPEQPPQPTA